MASGTGNDDVAAAVLARYGTTFAEEAGIRLTDEPAPLFQLLVLAQLLSARIGAGIAVGTAGELFAAGWTTPQRLRDASRASVVAAWAAAATAATTSAPRPSCGRWRRWSSTGTAGTCAGSPRRPGRTPGRGALLQEVKGIGPTGRGRLPARGPGVWPWLRPYLDDRAREGRGGSACPTTPASSPAWSPATSSLRFAAGLVRISRLRPRAEDPLGS